LSVSAALPLNPHSATVNQRADQTQFFQFNFGQNF